MPTAAMPISDSPADVVAGLSLTPGGTYAFQAAGTEPALLHLGGAAAPATTAPATRLAPGDTLQLTISDSHIWGWTYGGQRTQIVASRLAVHLGPPRDIEAVDVSGGDYVRERGFILQIGATGTVAYSTLDGGSTIRTETFAAAGTVSVGGIPVALRTVYQTGTTTGLALTAGLL